MDIRKKTVIIIGLTLVALILVLLALSQVIVLGEFNTLEKTSVQNDMKRVTNAIVFDLMQIDVMANEWANKESVQDILLYKNDSSATPLLDDKNFERLQYNIILISDAQGKIIAGKAYDLSLHREVPLPDSLPAYSSNINRLYDRADTYGLTGIVQLFDGPMLFSMRWVHKNGDEGTRVGSVLMGRYLDEQVLMHLSSITKLPIEMFEYNDPLIPGDVISAKNEIPESVPYFIKREGEDYFLINTPVYTVPINETSVVTYTQVNDIFESPSFILRVRVPRTIYGQGKTTTDSFIVLLFFACLSFGIAILLLLEHTVLSRISRLSNEVISVGTTGDFSTRVTPSGTDEIGRLTGSVNWMLTTLDAIQAQLKNRLVQSEERYRIIFNSSNDIVFVFTLTGADEPESIIEVNDSGCKRLGYTRNEFLSLLPHTMVAEDPVKTVQDMTRNCLKKGHIVVETTFVTKLPDNQPTGCITPLQETFPVEIYAHSFLHRERPAILAVCHDITERKQVEQLKMEAFQQIEQNMEHFAILNDQIRNPLQVILLLSETQGGETDDIISQQVKIINTIIDQLDHGYLESDKIRNFLRKYYDMGKK